MADTNDSQYDIDAMFALMSDTDDHETLMEGLGSFVNFLNHEDLPEFSSLSPEETAKLLTEIFSSTQDKDEMALVLQAILKILDKFGALQNFAVKFIECKFPQKAFDFLSSHHTASWVKQFSAPVMDCINFLLLFQPEELGRKIKIGNFFDLLKTVNSDSTVNSEQIIKVLQMIEIFAAANPDSSHVKYIQYCIPYLSHSNYDVSKAAISLLPEMMSTGDLTDIPRQTGELIVEAMNRYHEKKDDKSIKNCFTCILCMSHYNVHWDSFLKHKINFNSALNDDQALSAYIHLGIYMLPPLLDFPIQPNNVRTHLLGQKCQNPIQFAQNLIEPTLYLMSNLKSVPNEVLMIYAIILQILPDYKIPNDAFLVLSSLSNSSQNCETVLKIVSLRANQQELYNFDIIKNLTEVELAFNCSTWYLSHLEPLVHISKMKSGGRKKLSDTHFTSLKQLVSVCKDIPSHVLFANNDLSDIATRLMNAEGINDLIELLRNKLSSISIPVNSTPIDDTPVELSRKNKQYDINNISQNFGLSLTGTGAAALYLHKSVTDESIQRAIQTSELRNIINPGPVDNMSPTEKSYAAFFFSNQSLLFLTKFQFKMRTQNGTKIIPVQMNDNLFQLSSFAVNNINDVKSTNDLEIETSISSIFKLSPFPKERDIIPAPLKHLLDLLKQIHEYFPTMNLSFPEFEERIKKLSAPFTLLTFFSPQVSIITKYPFLFTPELKRIAYFINTLDFTAAANRINEYMYHEKPTLCMKNHATATISRDKIWEEGLTVLKTYGKTPVVLDFQFRGEMGFGTGPMNQFFSLMSYEFAKTKRKMWLCDNMYDEYASRSKCGLVPSPENNAANFEYFGIFCSKAIQLHTHVPLPLSNAFFKLFLGKKLDFEDLGYSSDMFNSPEKREGFIGLTFVFPGTEKELIKGGKDTEVTNENVSRFVELMRESLDGNLWEDNIKAFKRGFYTNIREGFDSMLTPEDLKEIIIGETPQLKYEDLRKYVQIGSGFHEDDEEIEWLFRILANLSSKDMTHFILFLTGNERLPVGGLEKLNPRMTVALKSEKKLPTASTCSSYLKLSKYQTKEELEKDLLVAIRNCTTFDLS